MSKQMSGLRKHGAKIVVSFMFFVLVFTSFLVMGSNASSMHVAEASEGEQVVVVSSGDTLWSIASRLEGRKSSIGFMVFRIKDRNQLQSETITPGQKLIIPNN